MYYANKARDSGQCLYKCAVSMVFVCGGEVFSIAADTTRMYFIFKHLLSIIKEFCNTCTVLGILFYVVILVYKLEPNASDWQLSQRNSMTDYYSGTSASTGLLRSFKICKI